MRMIRSPLIPGIYASPEEIEMVLICHRNHLLIRLVSLYQIISILFVIIKPGQHQVARFGMAGVILTVAQ